MPKSLEDLTVDELLAQAKAMQPVYELSRTLMNDPEARAALQQHTKRLQPQRHIPELEQREQIEAAIAAERKEREKLQQQMLERDIRERVERQRAEIKAKYGFSDDDVKAVEALMMDKDDPIPSYSAAAKVHNASKQSAQPTSAVFEVPVYTMPDDEDWKAGYGNKQALNKIGLRKAYEALNEIRSGKMVNT